MIQRQAIFDKTLTHLRKQGVAAINYQTSRCVYRGKDSTMCAIGCHIPDHLYDPQIEGKGIWGIRKILEKSLGLAEGSLLGKDIGFLGELQDAHDLQLSRGGLKDWEWRMSEIAKMYGLVYTKV